MKTRYIYTWTNKENFYELIHLLLQDDSMSEQQRMVEGRRMFQIFAAKMFEQRVLTAYREKVQRFYNAFDLNPILTI